MILSSTTCFRLYLNRGEPQSRRQGIPSEFICQINRNPREIHMPSRSYVLVLVLVVTTPLAACSTSVAATTPPPAVQPTVMSMPTSVAIEPTATQPPPTLPPGPAFEPATYTDKVAGFEFDYPVGWTVGPVEQYSRGGITAFTSWKRPSDVLPDVTPPGGTRLDVVVQLWDPKGDLAAFVKQRKLAWDASGTPADPQEEWTLSDGRAARSFLVHGADESMSYVFVTTLGEKYLTISGYGDLSQLAAIAHTVRPIPSGG